MQETRLLGRRRAASRVSMRSKEYAHDYRYFPEPDLPPLDLDAAWIDELRAALPELPDARRRRFASEYGLPAYDAQLLTGRAALADYFEAVAREHGTPRPPPTGCMDELLRELPGDGDEAVAAAPSRRRTCAACSR